MTEPTERDLEMAREWWDEEAAYHDEIDLKTLAQVIAIAREEGRQEERRRCVLIASNVIVPFCGSSKCSDQIVKEIDPDGTFLGIPR